MRLVAPWRHGLAAVAAGLLTCPRPRILTAPSDPPPPPAASLRRLPPPPPPYRRAPYRRGRAADSLEHLSLALAKLSECHARLFADGGRRDVVLARRLRPFLQAGIGELQDMQLGCLYYSPR